MKVSTEFTKKNKQPRHKTRSVIINFNNTKTINVIQFNGLPNVFSGTTFTKSTSFVWRAKTRKCILKGGEIFTITNSEREDNNKNETQNVHLSKQSKEKEKRLKKERRKIEKNWKTKKDYESAFWQFFWQFFSGIKK